MCPAPICGGLQNINNCNTCVSTRVNKCCSPGDPRERESIVEPDIDIGSEIPPCCLHNENQISDLTDQTELLETAIFQNRRNIIDYENSIRGMERIVKSAETTLNGQIRDVERLETNYEVLRA